MTSKTSKVKKPSSTNNPIETFKDFGHSSDAGIFDRLMGNFDQTKSDEKPKSTIKTEFSLFNYQEHYENKIIKDQIQKLTEAIKQEIEMIKKADKSLLNDLKDIQKISVDSLPENPGIYNVRFLEIVFNILKALRAKIGESKTWMQALISKKKKRGSLFASLSKKKGTQYSLSQELSNARSVQ